MAGIALTIVLTLLAIITLLLARSEPKSIEQEPTVIYIQCDTDTDMATQDEPTLEEIEKILEVKNNRR